MDASTKARARIMLKNSLLPIAQYMDDDAIQEIMVNGPNDVWIERQGKLLKVEVEITDTAIRGAINLLARLENKEAKEGTATSVIDTRLEGMRVAAALPPVAVKGPTICIRKHNPLILKLTDYVASGAVPGEMLDVLTQMVCDHKNIIVAGGTSSGKTTFLNALLAEVDPLERIFTIEDTQELKVSGPNWVAFESNDQAGVSMRMLLRLALRSRPDRIILGEVRGGEAYDLMQAANTGHDGSFCTLHANGAFPALSRLENLILAAGINWPHEAICSQIAETFHYVVFMARRNGVRQLEEIIELIGYDKPNQKYAFKTIFNRRSFHAATT